MIYRLPNELIEHIGIYLDYTDVINLSKTCIKINYIDNEKYWKYLCNVKYKIPYNMKINNWKQKFIRMGMTVCIHCYKKTKYYNNLLNEKICKKCENKYSRYHTISRNKVIKRLLLTQTDLITCKNINNSYLKSDILNIIKNKYNLSNYNKIIKSKQLETYNKSLLYIFRINVLHNILYNTYNINPSVIYKYINNYSKNSYIKYIRNTDNINKNKYINLIKQCIELEFIIKHTNINYIEWVDNFDKMLLYYLLTTINIPYNINKYINNKIYNIILLNKDKFIRKKNILNYMNNINLNDLDVYNYIYYNNITFSELKNRKLLKIFLYINTDISQILLENIFYNNKYDIYIYTLNKWYIHNKMYRYLLPKELYRYIIL